MYDNNKGYYYLGIFYFDKKDKRIIVPKVNKAFGWTINFARPQAYLVLLILILAVVLSNYI
ncbi:MAG: DUF5808 domain-containing protein [Prolixibacteraceae bacterium]|jgi:uncharacterized membrane protein|nr:DUF5808 domain-containing protein [Prolixibacteraceae bacterium]